MSRWSSSRERRTGSYRPDLPTLDRIIKIVIAMAHEEDESINFWMVRRLDPIDRSELISELNLRKEVLWTSITALMVLERIVVTLTNEPCGEIACFVGNWCKRRHEVIQQLTAVESSP